ncbi:MAG: hypothetical protein KJ069_11375 [Anaerolineae bacterium]|nr:hypothetical protein [Anaerolineae bacterium]
MSHSFQATAVAVSSALYGRWQRCHPPTHPLIRSDQPLPCPARVSRGSEHTPIVNEP